MMTIERQERVKYSKISNHPQTICGMAVSHGASRRSLMCLNNQMGVLVKPWPGNVLSFLPCFPFPPLIRPTLGLHCSVKLSHMSFVSSSMFVKLWLRQGANPENYWFWHKHLFGCFFRVNVQTFRFHPPSSTTTSWMVATKMAELTWPCNNGGELTSDQN